MFPFKPAEAFAVNKDLNIEILTLEGTDNTVVIADEFYKNPLIGEDSDDLYVLHFYDLSAKQPHTMYTFVNEGEIVVSNDEKSK